MVGLMAKQNINPALYVWVFLGVLGVLFLLGMADKPLPQGSMKIEKLAIQTAAGKTRPFEVEIADTPSAMETGLMYRDHLDATRGMLFIYPHEQESAMWMKNTRIPLDMLFIKTDGTISHIHEGALPFDETPIPSVGPVKATLELAGGIVKKEGIAVGDKVKFPLFDENKGNGE